MSTKRYSPGKIHSEVGKIALRKFKPYFEIIHTG
jgi:hypothetical protein